MDLPAIEFIFCYSPWTWIPALAGITVFGPVPWMAGPPGLPVPSGPVPAFAGRHYQFQAPPGAGPHGPFLAGGACPPRLASGCQSGVAAGCLASPLRRRGPHGLPMCRSGCAGPAAVACPLPPSRMRGLGTTGCCSELSSLRIGALPLLPCRVPCEARGGAGGEWRCGPAHGGNLYHMGGTLLSRPECAGSKFHCIW